MGRILLQAYRKQKQKIRKKAARILLLSLLLLLSLSPLVSYFIFLLGNLKRKLQMVTTKPLLLGVQQPRSGLFKFNTWNYFFVFGFMKYEVECISKYFCAIWSSYFFGSILCCIEI